MLGGSRPGSQQSAKPAVMLNTVETYVGGAIDGIE